MFSIYIYIYIYMYTPVNDCIKMYIIHKFEINHLYVGKNNCTTFAFNTVVLTLGKCQVPAGVREPHMKNNIFCFVFENTIYAVESK
jgi:hypothetical protein